MQGVCTTWLTSILPHDNGELIIIWLLYWTRRYFRPLKNSVFFSSNLFKKLNLMLRVNVLNFNFSPRMKKIKNLLVENFMLTVVVSLIIGLYSF